MGGRRHDAWSSCAENGPRVRARLSATRTHRPLERHTRSNPRRGRAAQSFRWRANVVVARGKRGRDLTSVFGHVSARAPESGRRPRPSSRCARVSVRACPRGLAPSPPHPRRTGFPSGMHPEYVRLSRSGALPESPFAGSATPRQRSLRSRTGVGVALVGLVAGGDDRHADREELDDVAAPCEGQRDQSQAAAPPREW
jgi:hypothetical protein